MGLGVGGNVYEAAGGAEFSEAGGETTGGAELSDSTELFAGAELAEGTKAIAELLSTAGTADELPWVTRVVGRRVSP